MMYVAAAKDFQQLGCQLYVVNTANNLGIYVSHFRDAGYIVLHLPCLNTWFSKCHFCRLIYKYIKKEGIDVIHVHRDDIKFIVAFCAWFCGIRCVCTHHSIYYSNWYSRWYHIILRKISSRVFHCKQQSISRSVYLNERNYYHNDTILVNNWYDKTKFYPASYGEKEDLRRKLNISKDAKVIVSVGSCRELKRHKDIIEAVAIIKKIIPDIYYFHLGEGEMLEEEKRLVSAYELNNSVRFVGNQTDVRKYLVTSDIYVMTSRLEGLSLSTIEAMACGIPTILYNVPGLHDFNMENECSLQVKELPAQLANGCLQLLEDNILAKKLVENALDLVHSKFSMEKNIKEIIALYKG